MTQYSLKRLKIKDQLPTDFLKLFSLIEKTTTAFMFIFLTFFNGGNQPYGTVFPRECYKRDTRLFSHNCKKMYHDEALSELHIRTDLKQEILNNALRTIGYSENEDGIYSSNKRIFSIFYCCTSEKIIYSSQDEDRILTGPYNRLLELSTIMMREASK